MRKRQDGDGLLDQSIRELFTMTLRMGLTSPRLLPFLYRTLRRQQKAARVRQGWEERGVHVPAFMIFSVTNRCNLACKGCYARAHHRSAEDEMTTERCRSVLEEASALGFGIILLAGGEPLTRPELLDITQGFPEIIFPMFTNGLLIDDAAMAKLETQRHVIPVISLEGRGIVTDERRGQGVFAQLDATMEKMRRRSIVFGTSLTVTRKNFTTVVNEAFIEEMVEKGCRLFFFIDYIPVQEGTDGLALTEDLRATEASQVLHFRSLHRDRVFMAFPGGEAIHGGCLAAGRGFVHVSAEGRVEPCPFSPYSDVSLKELSLREALQSEFLSTIRGSLEHLTEANGGCALWENREWVASLAGGQATDRGLPAREFIVRAASEERISG
jgi:MoaA/NifB/PqqE/SkfB family radical SAM enzyme